MELREHFGKLGFWAQMGPNPLILVHPRSPMGALFRSRTHQLIQWAIRVPQTDFVQGVQLVSIIQVTTKIVIPIKGSICSTQDGFWIIMIDGQQGWKTGWLALRC